MDTRRDFLKKAMLLSGAAGMASAVPASIKKALDIDPDPGSDFYDAEHVVILMQENRAFDHCFGALRGVRGFNDPRAITLPDKKPVWLQTNKKGETYAPFHFSMEDSKITWMGYLPHSRASQVDANNQGKFDGWLEAKRSGNPKYAGMPLTMGHYSREDLPFNYALADAFTICDQHFSSAMTSTWPNRLYLWSGTIRGEKSGDAKAYINNDIPYGEAHWKTFPERMEESGVSWKVYQNDLDSGGGFKEEERAWLSNFGCNPLEFLSQFNVRFYSGYVKGLQTRAEVLPDEIADLETRLEKYSAADKRYEKLKKAIDKKKEVLQDTHEQLGKWTQEKYSKLSAYQKNLYQKAFTINDGDPDYRTLAPLTYEDQGTRRTVNVPKGDVLYQFRKDVDSGQLPTVSWLVPSQNFSDHPSAPWYGTWLTSEILDILTRRPEVWKKTIFILTYDENDGYFDHVPPFVAPDPHDPRTGRCSAGLNTTGVEYIRKEQEIREGISKRSARTAPIGLGYRVPMIIASPWSRGGKVCSQVFDHTSSLQFLENFLHKKMGAQIRQENISAWRRAICGDLTAVFTKFESPGKEKLPFLDRDRSVERIYNAKFKQEPGSYKALTEAEISEFMQRPSQSPWRPRQEPGTRPANALPYELYVDGHLQKDKKSFEITMRPGKDIFGDRACGAPFIVYAPGDYLTLAAEASGTRALEPVRTWNFAVSAGDSLSESWPLAHFGGDDYHLRVYGPNGFFREFKGSSSDPQMELRCSYERKRMMSRSLTGNLILQIRNLHAHDPATIEITDNAYQQPALHKSIAAGSKQEILLNLKQSSGWYDFTVKVAGLRSFSQRFAGRVETGKESISDPFMGKG